jgi:hypothetical protein
VTGVQTCALPIYNITLERLEEIDQERQNTMNDPKFQEWISKLNVSQSYVNPEGLLKARDLTSQYNYSEYSFSL